MSTFNMILNGMQITALMLISGGTVVIGALIAPLLFKAFNKKDASKFIVKMFEQFDDWLKLSAGMLLGAKLLQLIMIDKFQFVVEKTVNNEAVKQMDMGLALTLFLVLAISALSFHIVFKTTPALKKYFDNNKDRQSKDFNEIHKQSEMLHKVNFILGFLLLLSFIA